MVDNVLFYFWAHEVWDERTRELVPNMAELDTPKVRDLVQRVNVVFNEFIFPDVRFTSDVESDWNKYIETGELPRRLQECMLRDTADKSSYFLASLMTGTRKRFVLERTREAPFDFLGEQHESDMAFLKYPLAYAMGVKEAFLRKGEAYQAARDADVAQQILAIKEPTLVVFGSGHPEIETRVAKERQTEVHVPYEGYPIEFETQMRMAYRRSGVLDKELYLRCTIEQVAFAACKGSVSGSERDRVAHEFAKVFSSEQIEDYCGYVGRCAALGFGPRDSFEAYLTRESLPSVETVLASVRERTRKESGADYLRTG